MLPIIGLAGAAGAVVGSYLGFETARSPSSKIDVTLLEGAVCGAAACALPVWAVMWVVWLARRLKTPS